MYVYIMYVLCMYVCMCVFVCMYVCMYVCVCVYVCMYVVALKCDKSTFFLFGTAWTQSTLKLIRLYTFHPIKFGNALNKPLPFFYVLSISWSINFLLLDPT